MRALRPWSGARGVRGVRGHRALHGRLRGLRAHRGLHDLHGLRAHRDLRAHRGVRDGGGDRDRRRRVVPSDWEQTAPYRPSRDPQLTISAAFFCFSGPKRDE